VKATKRKQVEPYDTGVRQYTDLRMRPFCASAEEHEYALMLTEACSTYESDENNAALILLLAGIAAMENTEDRQTLAGFCVERIFSRTQVSQESLKGFMLEWEEKEKIVGTV
jgi:hypothetical protein